MLGYDFNHGIITKYVIAFGRLFSDINVIRKMPNSTEIQRIKVPITYSPKHKFFYRVKQDPALDKKVAVTFPRMAFAMNTPIFDPSRRLNKLNKFTGTPDGTKKNSVYAPVPYNFLFDLSITTDETDDILQIYEQILPFFTPELTVSIQTATALPVSNNVPIVFVGSNLTTDYTGGFEGQRREDFVFNFILKGYLYGPIQDSKYIRKIQVDYHVTPTEQSIDDPNVPRSVRNTIEPDPIDAEPGEPYVPVSTIEDFADGKRYNSVTGVDE